MSAAMCPDCRKPLGKNAQGALLPDAERCADCLTTARIRWWLKALPFETDREWDQLTDFEMEFLPSARRQFAQHGTLSEKQYQVLERIWARL
jgi:hypothetical protein